MRRFKRNVRRLFEKYAPVKEPILFDIEKLKDGKYCIKINKGFWWKKRYVILENVHLCNLKNYWGFEKECTSKNLADVKNTHIYLTQYHSIVTQQ